MAGGMAKRFLDKYLEIEKGIEVVKKTPQTETKQTNTSTTQRNVNNNSSEQGRGEEIVNEEREIETTSSTSEGEEN